MTDTPQQVAVPINVDLDEIRDIAHKGVRRAAVFMGLGLNAAADEEFKNHRLSQLTNVDLVPTDAGEAQIGAFTEAYAK